MGSRRYELSQIERGEFTLATRGQFKVLSHEGPPRLPAALALEAAAERIAQRKVPTPGLTKGKGQVGKRKDASRRPKHDFARNLEERCTPHTKKGLGFRSINKTGPRPPKI